MLEAAQHALDELMAGNARFRAGQPRTYTYKPEELAGLAVSQKPIAAIVACADSRVSPDIVFDQPLGSIFASRVPGNVASDSAKWMLEIAVTEFKVPLVMVMGHTGCLAVGQLLDGDKGGSGGSLRYEVLHAVYEARASHPEDVFRESVVRNAQQTVRRLKQESYAVRKAAAEGRVELVAALYEMETGRVILI